MNNPSANNITEEGEGIAIAYTMGSMKIAGNRNEVSDNNNSTADSAWTRTQKSLYLSRSNLI